MIIKKRHNSFLYLEDGKRYQGWSFSNVLRSVGEVVFNTGMTGYQEVITDPSYYRQIILFTYPEIGNTGANVLDIESDMPSVQGIIAKNICIKPSNWRSSMSFADYLIRYNIPHIFGIDTRKLTKDLRNNGVMMGCISTKILSQEELNLAIQSFNLSSINFVDYVTTKRMYSWLPKYSQDILNKKQVNDLLTVVIIDYGVKFNILNRLSLYGCKIIVMPSNTNYETILNLKPDGVLLSNGPGDPALIKNSVLKTIRSLVESNIPVFGICLGHQLLSIVFGAKTDKLKFGHRGLNHPSGNGNVVKMTSQNHGYVVSMSTIPNSLLRICSLNCNDLTVSGIVHKVKPCFSVQYHPEASPGPHDSDFLFSHFVKVMLACKHS